MVRWLLVLLLMGCADDGVFYEPVETEPTRELCANLSDSASVYGESLADAYRAWGAELVLSEDCPLRVTVSDDLRDSALANYRDHTIRIRKSLMHKIIPSGFLCRDSDDDVHAATVLAHELGHALGTGGHDPDSALMNAGFLGCSNARPSKEEINRAKFWLLELREPDEPQPADSLCFRIDDESGVSDYLPTIRPTLSVVSHRWGWPILISDECKNVVTIGNVPELDDGRHPAGKHIPLELPDGSKLSAAFTGGQSTIVLDRWHLENGKLTDFTDCQDGDAFFKLSHILTHEVGHVVRAKHSDDEDSPMYREARECWDGFPTADDLAGSVRPSISARPTG